jgi:hypothetical protein
MSFVTAAPEAFTAAAGDLASIGSSINEASAAAAPRPVLAEAVGTVGRWSATAATPARH